MYPLKSNEIKSMAIRNSLFSSILKIPLEFPTWHVPLNLKAKPRN
ncbi:MAG: hypothetical protein ACI85Q_002802 [Salibacteraceae bacterium]|jgi:hypothetical protein